MRPVQLYLLILSFCVICSVTSCVSTSKYKAAQQEAQKNDSLYTWSMRTLKTCQDANTDLTKQKTSLQNQTNELNTMLTASKDNNSLLRKQLQDLSALSSAQAESIKKSLDNIGAKDTYIQDLRAALARRDSANLVMVMNLKATIGGFGPADVNIHLEKGTVYLDLSDKILFNGDSNSYVLNDKAKGVLGRLARVLNEQPDLEFMVEGHTDSIPPTQDPADNWDLSVKRATAIIRVLQKDYNISPLRMTAAGRSEYITVADNDTPDNRALNRRTRIVIFPQNDQLLKVLERRPGQAAAL